MTIHEDVIERIISSAIALIQESDGNIKTVTTRMIAERANVAVGAINYYFKTKNQLIEIGLQRLAEKQREKFTFANLPVGDFDSIVLWGQEFADSLFENPAVSEIAILENMKNPQEMDATAENIKQLAAVVSENGKMDSSVFIIITVLQTAFLRRHQSRLELGCDFMVKEQRDRFVEKMAAIFF
ncbi:TetR/AcrR family transcriptional regulator [Enterococcus sp. LJL51]|uniref:TetR/AcrR family transcriptional regulator n=1 Tax=Enterococcus sp. LJL51 TaxID=3416656 RepID=UPI003CF51B8D